MYVYGSVRIVTILANPRTLLYPILILAVWHLAMAGMCAGGRPRALPQLPPNLSPALSTQPCSDNDPLGPACEVQHQLLFPWLSPTPYSTKWVPEDEMTAPTALSGSSSLGGSPLVAGAGL